MLTEHRAAGPSLLPPPLPAPAAPSVECREPARGPSTSMPDRDGVIVALGCGLACGILLGCWCRMFAYSLSVNGVLANLASPWVAAAFATGALVTTPSANAGRRPSRSLAAGIAGAIGGAVCLVVATIVYYGPARTGTFDFSGAAFRTVFWTGAGTVVGAVFGAAGAVWRTSFNARVRAACIVMFGTVVVGEACFLIAAGATKYDAFSHDVVVVVAIIGLAIPLLFSPRRTGAKGVAIVALLAIPVTLAGMVAVAIAVTAVRALRAVM